MMIDPCYPPHRGYGYPPPYPYPYDSCYGGRTAFHGYRCIGGHSRTFATDAHRHTVDPPWGARPLQIAHVGQSLVRGGVEQWLKGLIGFFDSRWATVTDCIVTDEHLVDPVVAVELGVSVEIGQEAAVRRVARECDVVLCWGPAELGQWLQGCRPKLGIFVAHGEGIWTRDTLAACLTVLDHVVAVSGRVRDRLCLDAATTVIRNGIDSAHLATTRSRQSVRQSLGFVDHDFVLGYVGRFSPEKRVHALIEATALLPPRFKTLLVGWGPLEAELRASAQAWLPGRHAFACGGDYLGDYYHAMDAFCLVSEAEGFSLAALEAMMCQIPLIATPVGMVPEAIHDRLNGVVVAGTVDSICEAAEMLAAHPAWARGVAAEGKAYADEFGHARTMAASYELLLAELWKRKFCTA
jgi:glycosyltransferase involved in cell wall biosynthesis